MASIATDIPAGIYVSPPWKLAYREQQLQGCDTFVRACTNSNAKLRGASTLYRLTGKLPADRTATYGQRSSSLDRYLDGNLMISTS